ncbi:hypothetical protein B0T22DRAFT_469921 [Podospora appendiculata]|uniref:SWIM-type domain-containing protein n=1 Tax=Podospora appendiculata TaxID=314037 RepID=A0AAE0X3X5_9PEZI|nr:hypothetical protein B0T22DRAFT_469921 [Podospora appendiculata]
MPPQVLASNNDNDNDNNETPQLPPPLPTSRQVLTSLIDAIAAIPPPTTTTLATPTTTNALRLVPVAHRHLIVTLHVLFPGLLLPALDVLDRGLVGRVELDLAGGDANPSPPVYFYLVRSTAAARTRRKDGTGGGWQYIVRLGAWNCTCAAFAFAAFPAVEGTAAGEGVGDDEDALQRQRAEEQITTTTPRTEMVIGEPSELAHPPSDHKHGHEHDRQEGKWSFGGLSADGSGSSGGPVPVCKHLLACLLAERWGAALGRYVAAREVGREEMAGIVADV